MYASEETLRTVSVGIIVNKRNRTLFVGWVPEAVSIAVSVRPSSRVLLPKERACLKAYRGINTGVCEQKLLSCKPWPRNPAAKLSTGP